MIWNDIYMDLGDDYDKKTKNVDGIIHHYRQG